MSIEWKEMGCMGGSGRPQRQCRIDCPTPKPPTRNTRSFCRMSYIGNDWQAEAANMVKAMAAHRT